MLENELSELSELELVLSLLLEPTKVNALLKK